MATSVNCIGNLVFLPNQPAINDYCCYNEPSRQNGNGICIRPRNSQPDLSHKIQTLEIVPQLWDQFNETHEMRLVGSMAFTHNNLLFVNQK